MEQKGEKHRSTLYSFDGPFKLLHADVAKLESLGEPAADLKYCLVFADLFTSKVYTGPMKSGKSITKKIQLFYVDVNAKRKCRKMRLQTNQELLENKIK